MRLIPLLFALFLTFVVVVGISIAWNGPTAPPPTGSGALSSNAANTSVYVVNDGLDSRISAYRRGVGQATTSLWASNNAGAVGTFSNDPFYIRTNSADVITVLTNGNIGIGMASPAQKLDVEGDVRVGGGEIFGISGVQGIGAVTTGWYSDANNLAARFPGASGDFYVQSSGAAANYLRAGAGIGGLRVTGGTSQVEDNDESITKTNFTQALASAGFQVITEYTANAYTPGLFWSTTNNNSTKPKAGIYLQETGTGTKLIFGTSEDYATGITKEVYVTERGEVRTPDPNNASNNRLWGKGVPGINTINGPSGQECLLSNTGPTLRVARSVRSVEFNEKEFGCPASWWVCTSDERGWTGGPNYPACGLSTNTVPRGGCGLTEAASAHAWISSMLANRDGYIVHTDGTWTNVSVMCRYHSVWCCTYQ